MRNSLSGEIVFPHLRLPQILEEAPQNSGAYTVVVGSRGDRSHIGNGDCRVMIAPQENALIRFGYFILDVGRNVYNLSDNIKVCPAMVFSL